MENGWRDLPGDAEFVGKPTALDFATAVSGEFGPVVIDFGLVFAIDDEGDGFVEFEFGTAIEGEVGVAFEFEADRHDAAGFAGADFGVAGSFEDAGVFEDGGVEADGFLSLAVEPEAVGDFLHTFAIFGFRSHTSTTNGIEL